jgi:hypothetical protein
MFHLNNTVYIYSIMVEKKPVGKHPMMQMKQGVESRRADTGAGQGPAEQGQPGHGHSFYCKVRKL